MARRLSRLIDLIAPAGAHWAMDRSVTRRHPRGFPREHLI
jgi:hypothetical protein